MGRLRAPVALAALASAAAAATNICGTNATIGGAVVASLNMSYPGLEAVAAAAAAGDLNTACEELAVYYRNSNTSWWLRLPPVTPGTGLAGGAADLIVFNDTFYFSGVTTQAKVPRNADGGLNWLDKGPLNDVEFMNCLNRFTDPGPILLSAWQSTGNPIYAAYLGAMLTDWVLHLPCPNATLKSLPACVPAGLPGTPCSWAAPLGSHACATGTMESPWRSLEMGIRMLESWPQIFFGLQGSDAFTTDARVLTVLGAAQHNAALLRDGDHPASGTPNWQIGQYSGLLSSAVVWPELLSTPALRDTSIFYLDALNAQVVYPDGVETEQASGYDSWTATEFFTTLSLLSDAGLPRPNASYVARVEQMWAYTGMIVDPAGCLPRNGDADLCGSGYDRGIAQYFGRGDWTYINTSGKEGTLPPGYPAEGPSSAFPWAGQLALRSGYDAAATWAFFDVGPYGSSGHGHRDRLHLNLHARGSMLLVDSGRFSYAGNTLSAQLHAAYASNASAHNTLTIDGCDQLPQPAVATAPVPAGSVVFGRDHDVAWGNMSFFAGLAGAASHARGVWYQRSAAQAASADGLAGGDGDWLVVVDVVTSDRPRSVQATWHTHPNASVALDAASGVATVGGVDYATGKPTPAQVCVVPAGGAPATPGWASATTVRGRMADPAKGVLFQGWYSQEYADAWPSTTLVYDAAGVAPPAGVWAWLLVPTAAPTPCADMAAVVTGATPTAVTVKVTVPGAADGVSVVVPVGQA